MSLLSLVLASGSYSLVASHYRGFPCGEWALECAGFSSWGHTRLVAWWHVRSSWTRDQIHVPSIGRQILNHWITWEATAVFFIFSLYNSQNQILDFLDWFPKYFKSFLPLLIFHTVFLFSTFWETSPTLSFQVSVFFISTIIYFIFKSSAVFFEYYFL